MDKQKEADKVIAIAVCRLMAQAGKSLYHKDGLTLMLPENCVPEGRRDDEAIIDYGKRLFRMKFPVVPLVSADEDPEGFQKQNKFAFCRRYLWSGEGADDVYFYLLTLNHSRSEKKMAKKADADA